MIIIQKKFLKNTKINGIALFPFIFIRKKDDLQNKILINHEKIHIRQQIELLVVFFYFWYVIEYYYGLYIYKDSYKAYRNISFEKEAFKNERNLDYLKHRKVFSFRKYISFKKDK